MKAIAGFFGQADAVIKAFQADVDIALMPIEFRTARQAGLLSGLVDQVVAAVEAGDLGKAVELVKSMPPQTARATAGWLSRAEDYLAAKRAIDQLAAQAVALLGATR